VANENIYNRNHLVLSGNDGKIHGMSRSRKKLRIIKEKMEKYYLTFSNE